MYINITTLEQVTEDTIRQLFSNTSFPQPFQPPEDYAYIFPYPKPEHNNVTQYIANASPELTNLGHWEERWDVIDRYATLEEADTAVAADAEARRIAGIPALVSPRQIRQALTRAGLRASLEAAISAADQDTKDWYEFATEFRRDSPIVAAMGAALLVSELDLDNLWTLAGSL